MILNGVLETETLTVTSTQAILYSPVTSNPAYVSLPNLSGGTAKGICTLYNWFLVATVFLH